MKKIIKLPIILILIGALLYLTGVFIENYADHLSEKPKTAIPSSSEK